MAGKIALGTIALLFTGLIVQRVWRVAETSIDDHTSQAHSPRIISLADDRYHIDAVFTADSMLRLYTLDRDATGVLEVEAQELAAYLMYEDGQPAESITLRPAPQRGDSPGWTSCFVGELTGNRTQDVAQLSIPNLRIGDERFHLVFDWRTLVHVEGMPQPPGEEAEQRIHLVPGGSYTMADIEANGRTIPAEKYREFQARHDIAPQPGDTLCPVTRTKANPACTWVVGGKVYSFCCPPCINEFVELAKKSPEKLPKQLELTQR